MRPHPRIADRFAVIALAATLAASGAMAATAPPPLTSAGFMEIDALLVSARGRPNEEHRLHGLKAYGQGDYGRAKQQFEIAARFADKYSQHYLSLMHWHGVGVPVDRVQAYVWAELAAERGSHRLLLLREKMWSQLSPAEQAQAQDRGADFYARYGDEVAQPRAEREMRAFRRDMTGSRVGYRNQALETGGRPINGAFAVDTGSNAAAYAVSVAGSPDELYGREGGVRPQADYWREQDRLLEGTVEVGPVTPARKTP